MKANNPNRHNPLHSDYETISQAAIRIQAECEEEYTKGTVEFCKWIVITGTSFSGLLYVCLSAAQ